MEPNLQRSHQPLNAYLCIFQKMRGYEKKEYKGLEKGNDARGCCWLFFLSLMSRKLPFSDYN